MQLNDLPLEVITHVEKLIHLLQRCQCVIQHVSLFNDLETTLELIVTNRKLFQVFSSYQQLWKMAFDNNFLTLKLAKSDEERQKAEERIRVPKEIEKFPALSYDPVTKEVITWKKRCLDVLRSLALFRQNPFEWHLSFWTQKVEDSSLSISLFLDRYRRLLTPRLLMNYLASRVMHKISDSVFTCFVEGLDFRGLELEWAIRAYLILLGMPDNTQFAHCAIELFARVYCQQNPLGVFTNPDTVYMLFYSLMLLETDIHSHKILVKRTECDWVRNNRELEDGRGLSRDFLIALYRSAHKYPFLSVARRSFRGLVREVESESFFSWPRQLYLVIGDGILRIFASEERLKPQDCQSARPPIEQHDLTTKSFAEDDTFLVTSEKVLTFSATAKYKRGSPNLASFSWAQDFSVKFLLKGSLRVFDCEDAATRDALMSVLHWNMTLPWLARFARYLPE